MMTMPEQKPNSIVPPITQSQPEQVLDPIGLTLLAIMGKQEESRRLVDGLWQRYLMDCNRHKCAAVPTTGYVPELRSFPCPHNHGRFLVQFWTCVECGRKVCHHYKKAEGRCPECAGNPQPNNEG